MLATLYPASWMIATAVAIAVAIRHRAQLIICRRDYWRWLLAPWKLTTFAIAAAGLIAIAPLMHDPYWDRVDAAFMAVLTFMTAPWAVGVVWRSLFRSARPAETYVAVCAALLSAGWSFDAYQTLRLGAYPDVWLPSLIASATLYLMAGLLWSLDWSRERGMTLAFMHAQWPSPASGPVFRRIMWPATLYMLFVALTLIGPFVWDRP
jgi:hypothetical protein